MHQVIEIPIGLYPYIQTWIFPTNQWILIWPLGGNTRWHICDITQNGINICPRLDILGGSLQGVMGILTAILFTASNSPDCSWPLPSTYTDWYITVQTFRLCIHNWFESICSVILPPMRHPISHKQVPWFKCSTIQVASARSLCIK